MAQLEINPGGVSAADKGSAGSVEVEKMKFWLLEEPEEAARLGVRVSFASLPAAPGMQRWVCSEPEGWGGYPGLLQHSNPQDMALPATWMGLTPQEKQKRKNRKAGAGFGLRRERKNILGL